MNYEGKAAANTHTRVERSSAVVPVFVATLTLVLLSGEMGPKEQVGDALTKCQIVKVRVDTPL
jgi:hypothetical protein